MNKKELRVLYKEKRAALPEKDRMQLDDLLLIHFQQLCIPYNVNILMSFWPLDLQKEINIFLMTDFLRFRMPGLQVAYPVADFENNSMNAMLVNDDTSFEKNRYGIEEPVNGTIITAADVDMMFIPLLAFDKNGYRVGYGKGFYDRFLQTCKNDIIKIGFSYFEPEPVIDDISLFDVPLTTGITPGHIYEF